MRGLLVMMLIFVTGGGAAIWWGASTLRTSAAIAEAEPAAQPETSIATIVSPIVPNAKSPAEEIESDEMASPDHAAEASLPEAIETSTPEADAVASPPLQHTRIDPLARAREALEHDPFHPLALRDAARLSLKAGDSESAMVYLSRLIVANPDDHQSRTQLAELAAAEDAWTRVQHALQPIPETQRTTEQWRLLARAYTALGRLQAAHRAWSSVHQQAPDDPIAQLELADVFFKLGQLAEARRHVTAALEHQPSNVPALNLLAAIHWQQYEDSNLSDAAARRAAVTAWQSGLNIDPAQPEVRNILTSLGERN